MLCGICHGDGAQIETSCGHAYHMTCFQSSWKEFHLPCFVCQARLGVVISDQPNGDVTIGVHSGDFFCPCYRVTHPESKIVRCKTSVAECRQTENATTALVGLPVHYNMCVS